MAHMGAGRRGRALAVDAPVRPGLCRGVGLARCIPQLTAELQRCHSVSVGTEVRGDVHYDPGRRAAGPHEISLTYMRTWDSTPAEAWDTPLWKGGIPPRLKVTVRSTPPLPCAPDCL